MAHPGYLAIGPDDPLASPPVHGHEIVNNNRVFAYAAESGLGWLHACDECLDLDDVVLPGVGSYLSVAEDPAPWYNPRNLDSEGFLGIVGLELTGAENSTRRATVRNALRGGGAIGPAYELPRTMVLRGLAVAQAECSLQYGLRWLNEQFLFTEDPCAGDPLTFFECCPDADCDEDERPVGPCWPETYAELAAPPCSPDWWPSTYAELKAGPPYLHTNPPGDGDWCDWVGTYRELSTWLPPWSCCHELNVVTRMRQFEDARVTEGPTVLQRLRVSTGAAAEVEFTIAAADPTARPHASVWTDTWVS